jgi:hypothetical protein
MERVRFEMAHLLQDVNGNTARARPGIRDKDLA